MISRCSIVNLVVHKYFMLIFNVFPPTESIRCNVMKRPFVSSNLSSEVQERIYKDMELMSEQKIRSIYSGKIELITYSQKLHNTVGSR